MLHTPKKAQGSLTNNHKNHKHYFNQTSTFRTQPNQLLTSTHLSSQPRSYRQYQEQKLINRTPYHTHFHHKKEINNNSGYDHGRSFIQVDIQQVYEVQGKGSKTSRQPVQKINQIKFQIQSGKVKSQIKQPQKNNSIQQLQVMDYIQKEQKNNKNTNRYTYQQNQPIKIQQSQSSQNIGFTNPSQNPNNNTNTHNENKSYLQVKTAPKARIFGGKQKKTPPPKEEQTEQKIAQLRNYLKNNRKQLSNSEQLENRDVSGSRKLREKQFVYKPPSSNLYISFDSNNLSTLRQKNNSRNYDYHYNINESNGLNKSFNDNSSKRQQQKICSQMQTLWGRLQNLKKQNGKLMLKDQENIKRINQLQQMIKNNQYAEQQKVSKQQLQKQNIAIKQQLLKLQQKIKQYQTAIIKPVTNSHQNQLTLTQQHINKISSLMQDKLDQYGALLNNRVGLLSNRCANLEKNLKNLQQNLNSSRLSSRQPQIQIKNTKNTNKKATDDKNIQSIYLKPNLSSSKNRCHPVRGEQEDYIPTDNSQIRYNMENNERSLGTFKQSRSKSKLKQDKNVGSIIEIQSKIRYKYNGGNSRIKQRVIKNSRQEVRQKSRQKSTNTPEKWNYSPQFSYQQQINASNRHYQQDQGQLMNFNESHTKTKAGKLLYSSQHIRKKQQRQRQQLLLKISELQSILVIQEHKNNMRIQQLQKAHIRKLSQVQQKSKDKIIQILQSHKKQLQQIKEIYLKKIKQLQQQHKNERQIIQDNYKQKLINYDGTNTTRYTQLQSTNVQKVRKFQQQYKVQLNQLKQKFKSQLQSIHKQQMDRSTVWEDKQLRYKQNQRANRQKYNQLLTKSQHKQKLYSEKIKDMLILVKQVVKQIENCNMENFSQLQKQIIQITEQKKHIFYKLLEYQHQLLLQEQIYKNTKVWQIQQQLNQNNKKIQDMQKTKKQLVQKCVSLQNYIQKNVDNGQLSNNFLIEGVYDGYVDDFQSMSDHPSLNQVVCQCPLDKIISLDSTQIDYDQNEGKQAIKWVKHVQKALVKTLNITNNILKNDQQSFNIRQQDKYQL